MYEITAKDALAKLQDYYKRLGVIATGLNDTVKRTGAPIPDEIRTLYRMALSNYLQYGRSLFEELDKQGLKVEQVVLRDGKPVTLPGDPNSVKTLEISAPLIPSPVLPGVLTPVTGIGALPLIVAGASAIGGLVVRVVSSVLFKRLAVWIVGGYIAIKGLEQIAIILQGHPLDYKPIEQSEGYLKIYTTLLEKGAPEAEARNAALRAIAPPQVPGPSWGSLALGGLAIAAGAYVAIQVFGGSKT